MRIPFRLVLLAAVLAEIAGFILVGRAIGVLPTLGLTVLSALAGAALLRHRGIAGLLRARAEVDAGRSPAEPLFEGAVAAVAALLLIVPGFISDVAAILLMIPWIRRWSWRRTSNWASQTHRQFVRPACPDVVELGSSDYAAMPPRDRRPGANRRGA